MRIRFELTPTAPSGRPPGSATAVGADDCTAHVSGRMQLRWSCSRRSCQPRRRVAVHATAVVLTRHETIGPVVLTPSERVASARASAAVARASSARAHDDAADVEDAAAALSERMGNGDRAAAHRAAAERHRAAAADRALPA